MSLRPDLSPFMKPAPEDSGKNSLYISSFAQEVNNSMPLMVQEVWTQCTATQTTLSLLEDTLVECPYM